MHLMRPIPGAQHVRRMLDQFDVNIAVPGAQAAN